MMKEEVDFHQGFEEEWDGVVLSLAIEDWDWVERVREVWNWEEKRRGETRLQVEYEEFRRISTLASDLKCEERVLRSWRLGNRGESFVHCITIVSYATFSHHFKSISDGYTIFLYLIDQFL